ncbi:MAG: C10 family peptidase [Kiritimatiellae bacterium]|nr:C10 family peptidase [Kiritimatiellia bacterium]
MKCIDTSLLREHGFLPRLLVGAVASAALSAAFAAEITDDQAANAVQAWIDEGSSMGRLANAEVNSSATVETASGARLHIVKLAGGGFVITSADDRVDPVIAFSPTGTDLVQDASNPFWALLSGDIAAREGAAGVTASPTLRTAKSAEADGETPTKAQSRWAELLGKTAGGRAGASARAKTLRAAATSVSDVRVDSFVMSKWSQLTHNNYDNGLPCYNYYTPSNYVCGCVATAGAQLMRYWQWPTTSVTSLTRWCSVDGRSDQYPMYGGIYNWSSMPLVPADGATEAQRQAIGKLTYDIGVSVNMAWADGGSSANLFALVPRLKGTFGYANATAAVYLSGVYPYSLAELKKVVIPNCDARAPLAMSISGAGGHAVVVDGYGYSGTDFYIHVNFGWGEINDAWYLPPNIVNYNTIDGFVFNVFSQATGSILSGRVLDAGGAPIANAAVHLQRGSETMESKTSDANGIYAFIAPAGNYVVRADVLEGGVAVATAAIGVQLAATTGTIQDDNGNWDTTSVASIGNTYTNDIVITGVAAVPPPVFSPESCLFYPSTNVTITCADTDATIRYTLDGSAPDSNSPVYCGPIFVDDTVTIRARAFASGKNPSVSVGATYTYDAAAGAPKGDYFANPISISGSSGSYVIADNSAFSIEDEDSEPWHTIDENYSHYYQGRTVWYYWTSPGTGIMTFQTSCRKTVENGTMLYPTYIAVYTGNAFATLTRLAFSTTRDNTYATSVSVPVEEGASYRIVGMLGSPNGVDFGDGTFTLTWSGDLTVAQTETATTPVPVPYSWLDAYYPNGAANAAAYETLAFSDTDGDGFPAWAEYVANTDPANAVSRLTCRISIGANGVPVITVDPPTAREGFPRILQGKAALSDNWTDISAPAKTIHFYRVRIPVGE